MGNTFKFQEAKDDEKEPARVPRSQRGATRSKASLPSETNVFFVLDFGVEGRAVTPLTAAARNGVHALPNEPNNPIQPGTSNAGLGTAFLSAFLLTRVASCTGAQS